MAAVPGRDRRASASCGGWSRTRTLVGRLLGVAGLALVAYVLYTAVFRLPPRRPRPHLCRPVPDRRLDPVLGPVRTGRVVAEPVHRPLRGPCWACRHRCSSPSTPSTSSCSARCSRASGSGWPTGAGAFGPGQVRPGDGPARRGLPRARRGRQANRRWQTPVVFIFLIYLLHTTGELCLSPVGLSAMNRLAPAHLASLIMGAWFFASATGNFAAGLIAAAAGAGDGNWRNGDPANGARRLFDRRLGRDRGRGRGAGDLTARQEAHAPRYADRC